MHWTMVATESPSTCTRADFSTARNMAFAINRMMGPDTAEALDAVSISVRAPTDTAQKVSYLAELENIEVSKAASAAKIIVNARSGTIVIGSEVIVKPAAVATGALTVTIDENDCGFSAWPLCGGW